MRFQYLVRDRIYIVVCSVKVILIIVLIFLNIWRKLINFWSIWKIFIIIRFCSELNMNLIKILLAQWRVYLSLKCLRVVLVRRLLAQAISIFNIFVQLYFVFCSIDKLRNIIVLRFNFFKILMHNIILKIDFWIVIIWTLRILFVLI